MLRQDMVRLTYSEKKTELLCDEKTESLHDVMENRRYVPLKDLALRREIKNQQKNCHELRPKKDTRVL